MEQIAVFVDDAEHARQVLAPMLGATTAPARWVVVGCAPKLTHRIGKWVSHRNREQWREQWARTLRERLEPAFDGARGEREWVLARGALPALADELRRRFGSDLRVLDARRPKLGAAMSPLGDAQPVAADGRWAVGVAVAGSVATVLALSD